MRVTASPRAIRLGGSLAALAIGLSAVPAHAGVGDLLVAPTRLVIDSGRGTEVVLNNIGTDTANYRISLELRRMDAGGNLIEVPEAQVTEREKKTLEIITYAPRRVTLPPNQPQAIRVGIRAPADLPDGEYRAHMVFRAIPNALPIGTTPSASKSLSVQLIPIYGVMIPVIVRKGNLQVAAQMSGVHLGQMTVLDPKVPAQPALDFTLNRTGTRSVYGNVRVMRAGQATPLFAVRGIAVYAELGQRSVELPLTAAQSEVLHGPVTVEYREPDDLGGGLIASAQAVLK